MRLVPSRLLNGRIIVEPQKKKEQVINGVTIAESANAELSEGIVLAVAEDIKDVAFLGELAIYPTSVTTEQFYNGKSCLWVHVSNVWALYSVEDLQKMKEEDEKSS